MERFCERFSERFTESFFSFRIGEVLKTNHIVRTVFSLKFAVYSKAVHVSMNASNPFISLMIERIVRETLALEETLALRASAQAAVTRL